MNKSLVDTDILSYFLKGSPQLTQVFDYLKEYKKVTISEITYFEILAGLTFKGATKQITEFESFISTCQVLKLSTASLRISARVYAELRKTGVTIGTPDILISGIAIANNQKHYQPIKSLETSNWNEE